MTNNELRGSRKPQRYKLIKGMGLVCLLCIVTMVTVACNRPIKENNRINDMIDDTINLSSDLTTTDPTLSGETGVTTDSAQAGEPGAAADPAQTGEPGVTTDPAQARESEPTTKPAEGQEPRSSDDPMPSKGTVPASTPVPNTDFIPSEGVVHSTTAFTQGDYLFFKSGKLTDTVIAMQNLKTSKVTELTAFKEDKYFYTSEFYLKGSNIYYHSEGDIYRIGVDGKNRTRLFKGTATILGFHNDDIFALDRKAREVIRINKTGEKKSLAKLKSIDSLEAIMAQDGIYYISKSSNNTLNGNDPMDRLYYIDFDGKNKTEINKELDIYDLKSNEDTVFYLTFSEEPAIMEINKVKNHKTETLLSLSKEEIEAQGYHWFDKNNFNLLAVNTTHVFYGVDFDKIYSVGTDGEDYGLYLKTSNIEGIHPSAYFSRGNIDGDYLKIVFDCDEAPAEIYLINIQDKSTIKFKGGYYIPNSIDVEGEDIYYCKSSQYDPYGDAPEAYEFGRSKMSALK